MGEYRILPTPLRVGADERFTGRGVTIAFLDSGFYFHPDLTAGQNRIKRYVNVAQAAQSLDEGWDEIKQSDDSSWHGMMTSVVAALDIAVAFRFVGVVGVGILGAMELIVIVKVPGEGVPLARVK